MCAGIGQILYLDVHGLDPCRGPRMNWMKYCRSSRNARKWCGVPPVAVLMDGVVRPGPAWADACAR